MEGAALRRKREYDFSVSESWHSAAFFAQAQNGKLKGLSTYLSKDAQPKRRNRAAEAAAFFGNLKAQGFPIEVTRH